MSGVVAGLALAAALLLLVRPAPLRPRVAREAGDRPVPPWLALPLLVLAPVLAPGPAALAVVGAGAALGAWSLLRRRRRRVQAAATADRVLETCELLGAELASGRPPGAALGHAARAWPLLAPAAEAFGLGADVPAALRRLAAAPGAHDLRLVAAAWAVAHRTGAGLADALVACAADLRGARATRRVVEGELASARATARLVAGLPVLALGLGAGNGGDPVGFLLGSAPGLVCLAGGIALGLAGLTWIERIAAGVETS